MAFDSGTPHTIISTRIVTVIGLPQRKAVGVSRFEVGVGNILLGCTVRLPSSPSIVTMGKALPDLSIRCHHLSPGAKVYGVIGLDTLRRGRLVCDLPDGAAACEGGRSGPGRGAVDRPRLRTAMSGARGTVSPAS